MMKDNLAQSPQSSVAKLEEMIGFRELKNTVRTLMLDPENQNPGRYVFAGAPGTGKNYGAQLMGEILRETGILSQGQLIQTNASALLQTPEELGNHLAKARGGILFIDESDQLAECSAGMQLLRELIVAMADPALAKSTCIILAGYPNGMEKLFALDEGFARKVKTVRFDDYSPEEMLEILDRIATEPVDGSQYLVLDEEFRRRSLKLFRLIADKDNSNFGNARFVRHYLEACCRQMYTRLEHSEEKLPVLTVDDIPPELR